MRFGAETKTYGYKVRGQGSRYAKGALEFISAVLVQSVIANAKPGNCEPKDVGNSYAVYCNVVNSLLKITQCECESQS